MKIDTSSLLKRLLLLGGMAASVWWGFFVTQSPQPQSVESSQRQFSAYRAFQHVRALAQQPHPVGTAEHQRVRQYLFNTLSDLGLDPEFKSGTAIRAAGLSAAKIHNIMALIPGSNSRRTIVLMAHYDSVFYGPAAADDAAGVAAILETVRALLMDSQLRHNILIVLTDGEELGLLGANHFIKTYPEIEDVEIVLNLEARGTSGRSFMFETNIGNNNLIPQFNRANRWTAANSFTYTIYKLLPNSSDFTVIKPHGIQGLNFAFIDDLFNYHTMQDSPGRLSLASLQHQGSQLLNSTRYLASSGEPVKGTFDLIYFNNPFGKLTYYPQSWSIILALIPFIVLFVFNSKIPGLRWGKVFKSSGITLIVFILLLIIQYYLAKFLYGIHPHTTWMQQGELYQAYVLFWPFLSINGICIIAVMGPLTRYAGMQNVLTGIYLIFALLSLAVALWLPGMHYMILWPLLFTMTGTFFVRNDVDSPPANTEIIIILLMVFPALFLISPYIKFLHTALTTRMIVGGMFFASLVMLLCWKMVYEIIRQYEKPVITALGVAALLTAGFAIKKADFSPQQKKQTSLIHHYDFNKNESYWLSKDKETTPWTAHYLGSAPNDSTLFNYTFFGNDNLLIQQIEPDSNSYQSPEFTVLSDSATGNIRTLKLNVRFFEPSNIGRFSVANPSRLQQIAVNNKILFDRANPVPNQTEGFDRLLMFTDQSRGYELSLAITGPEKPMRLISTFYRTWFESSDPLTIPLPDTLMPKPFGFTYGMSWREVRRF